MIYQSLGSESFHDYILDPRLAREPFHVILQFVLQMTYSLVISISVHL